MKNFLVTGGAGFIGSNFIRYLLNKEPQAEVFNLDVLNYAGSLENLKDLPDPARHHFIHGNICDRKLVVGLLNEQNIDTIVHFAAETHVDRSILDPEQFIRTNVNGTFTLLDAAKNHWIASGKPASFRFHHVSTDEVYGSLNSDEPAWTESTNYAPNSPYAASKAASDHLVRAYAHTYGLPISITNCSNNYGPRQFPEKLIPLMILNAVSGKPLPIYGDGQQIRDWLYVDDHCEAILAVLKNGKPGESYNIGGGNQPANLVIVRTLCEILDELIPSAPHTPHEQLIQYVADRPGHDRRYAMDISKIETELGWRPKETLTSGLLKTATWYLAHPEWVDVIREQQDYQGWIARNYEQRNDQVS